ncbi:hypothetical protein ACFRAQ_34425 [Nocardia sp. NPDC056611]|uniref:hypothetical protein n=1 Tax=Nocardia sp. NPDC056611 TaxID=3345877 RepID=UPI00366F8D8B
MTFKAAYAELSAMSDFANLSAGDDALPTLLKHYAELLGFTRLRAYNGLLHDLPVNRVDLDLNELPMLCAADESLRRDALSVLGEEDDLLPKLAHA